jgi:hypothetical protein
MENPKTSEPDVVDVLRAWAAAEGGRPTVRGWRYAQGVMGWAADEIERLRGAADGVREAG